MFKVSVYFSRSSLGFPVMRKAAIVIVVNRARCSRDAIGQYLPITHVIIAESAHGLFLVNL